MSVVPVEAGVVAKGATVHGGANDCALCGAAGMYRAALLVTDVMSLLPVDVGLLSFAAEHTPCRSSNRDCS